MLHNSPPSCTPTFGPASHHDSQFHPQNRHHRPRLRRPAARRRVRQDPPGRRLRHQAAAHRRTQVRPRQHPRSRARRTRRRRAAQLHRQPRRPQGLQRLHRHRAHPGRPGQPPRPDPAGQGLRNRRQGHGQGRHRHLRIHRLPRRHRGSLRSRCSKSHSGLKFNQDFFAGYSPERINPGDKQHRLPTIKKVTSGSTPEIADFVDACTAASSPPAPTRPARSRWPKPPR
jgi:hypothetical protein